MAEPAAPSLEEILAELATKIERVKVLYEQYFMGIEKVEPAVQRKEVQRIVLTLQQQYIRNTGLRFKFNTLLQKWNIYITYWNRILREIENGTYQRHVARAQRQAAREGKLMPEEMLIGKKRAPGSSPDVLGGARMPLDQLAAQAAPAPAAQQPLHRRPSLDADTGTFSALVPSLLLPNRPTEPAKTTTATPPPRPPFPPPPPPAAARKGPPPIPGSAPPPQQRAAPPLPQIPGMSESELRQLLRKYNEARKTSGEGGSVSFESLVSSLSRQVGKVLERPGVRGVSFDVAIQGGRAVLKAKTKKAE